MNILDCSAALLVGGESLRMGSPKALLDFDGAPLSIHLTRVLLTVFDDVALVGDFPDGYLIAEETRVYRVPDRFPTRSSLNGIASALHAGNASWVAILACDAPRISIPLLRYMAQLRNESDADIILTIDDTGFAQPFHALWRGTLAAQIAHSVQRNELGIRRLLATLRCRTIAPEEWRRFDPAGAFLTNINTPEDWRSFVSDRPRQGD